MPHPNEVLLRRFYDAFHARDGETMAAAYAADAVFRDPVFGELSGREAGDMWRMLTARADELSVTASDIAADDRAGTARWVATYRFGRARRPVRNEIAARFAFQDGLIVRHDDTFGLWRWAAQALGPTGRLLGWTPFVQQRIRRDARRGLDAYRARRGG